MTFSIMIVVKGKRSSLYDGSNRLFSATSIPTVVKTVAAVLGHLKQTKNLAVYV